MQALACPSCGADDETGWSEDAGYDGVDLPDEAFGDVATPRRGKALAVVLCVVVLAAWLLMMTGTLR